MTAGTYIIAGSLSIHGPNITGAGVTIYMTAGNGYGYGTCTILNVKAILSAPTSGALQSIVFFSDRNAPTLPAGQAEVTMNYCNRGLPWTAFFYLPHQELDAWATVQGVNCFGMVADHLEPQGQTMSMG